MCSAVLRLAYFVAEDTFGHIGSLVRSLVYLVMYYTFAQPRAVAAEMYLVTAGIVYCCTGTAYFLSQVSPQRVMLLVFYCACTAYFLSQVRPQLVKLIT